MPKYQRRSVKIKGPILDMAEALGRVSDVCQELQVPRSTFCHRKTAYDRHRIDGFVPGKPIAFGCIICKSLAEIS